jgi:hypothetical protein
MLLCRQNLSQPQRARMCARLVFTGQMCLAGGLVLEHFGGADFVAGLCIGISLVANLAGIYWGGQTWRENRK